jgi:hypothetical protein
VSRPQRPAGWMVYGSPHGPGRFVPVPGRIARIRAWYRTWGARQFWTNGDACRYTLAWAAAGAIGLGLGWHRYWEAAALVVGATCLAGIWGRRR